MRSYGVYAAKIAGLPKPVIRRAEELLKMYEKEANDKVPAKTEDQSELEKALAGIDTDAISPVEALMKLYELKKLSETTEDAELDTRLRKMAG